MSVNFPVSLFVTELGAVACAVMLLLFDLFAKDGSKKNSFLIGLTLFGLAGLEVLLWMNPVKGSALGGSFVQDELSIFFKKLFILAGFFTVAMIPGYAERLGKRVAEFILLILFALSGMLFLISAADFLLFFVALETVSVSFYILTAFRKKDDASTEAGVKYVILGALSTAIFLFGLSFIYGSTGSTLYGVIHGKLAEGLTTPFLFGMALILCSLGFKIAAAPFHLWVPDIYQGAPTPVTAYLAIGSKTAGFAALVRILLSVVPQNQQLTLALAWLAGATILYGNLGAIAQTNLKRLLGYSSIGHAGYLLIGLATFHSSGNEAVLYYLAAYLFATGGAFLVLVALSRFLKSDEISELAGLSHRSPLLAATLLICLLSLAGVPPLAGFFAKFFLLWSAIGSGFFALAAVGAANVVISLYFYLKVIRAAYVDPSCDSSTISPTLGEKTLLWTCIAGVLLLGIWQEPLVALIAKIFAVSG